MKKMLLAAIAIGALLFAGCSSGDDSPEPIPTSPTGPVAETPIEVPFTSSITIDGQGFSPSVSKTTGTTYTVRTHFSPAEGGNGNIRSFHLVQGGTETYNTYILQLFVMYSPTNHINGTYPLNIEGVSQGSYSAPGKNFNFTGGTVTVTDLGSYKFRLVFNNVICSEYNGSDTKIIKGSFESPFAPF